VHSVPDFEYESLKYLVSYTDHEEAMTPLDVVKFVMTNKCFDLRDKIYGLQSLFEAQYRLRVDYSSFVIDVFLDTAMILALKEHISAIRPQGSLWS
jgi:hypothetical protein